MSIEIKINGNIILNVKELSIRSSLTTLSSSFNLLISQGKDYVKGVSALDFKAGETAEIKIEKAKILIGFVDTVKVSYTKDGHDIELTGRDRTADFIDSSVAEINIEGSIGLEQLLRVTLDSMGLQDIGIIDRTAQTSAELLIREDKNIVSEIGQTGFSFIEPFARLKQVLLAGGPSNIRMTRGGDLNMNVSLLNEPGNPGNNIIKGQFVQSHANRFNKYTFKAQADFSSSNFSLGVGEVIDNSGLATDSDIRTGRNIILESEENATVGECTERAAWESNFRRAKGTKLLLTVVGHTALTLVPDTFDFEVGVEISLEPTVTFIEAQMAWLPNARVYVVDVFSNTDALMLIESVHYKFSEIRGSTTELTLVPNDSYKAQAERDAVEARISLLGKV